ncbi:MAG: penicillin-binding transpeptidase domain-containing protein [Ginsengibacter sp.]
MNKVYFLVSIVLFTLASCTVNNAKINNSFKKYFDSAHVEGSFSFLNNQVGDITVYNMKMDTERVSPGTSFKILNTLIGIQTGNIENENTVIKDNADTNNISLVKAFKNSVVPYFQALARKIGKDSMRLWIDSISYGNKNISGPLDSFWLNNQLKISPDEQLGFMSKLYFSQLPFQKYAQQMVQDQMLQEDNTLYKYSYATGTFTDEKNDPNAWLVGWIEENRHVYFFVTYLKSENKNQDLIKDAIHINRSILQEMGFFKGEK